MVRPEHEFRVRRSIVIELLKLRSRQAEFASVDGAWPSHLNLLLQERAFAPKTTRVVHERGHDHGRDHVHA